MAYIQSATAEIRRGEKERKKKKIEKNHRAKNIMATARAAINNRGGKHETHPGGKYRLTTPLPPALAFISTATVIQSLVHGNLYCRSSMASTLCVGRNVMSGLGLSNNGKCRRGVYTLAAVGSAWGSALRSYPALTNYQKRPRHHHHHPHYGRPA